MGVSPGNDVKYLAKDYSVYTKSTLDIRHLAELCNYEPGGLGSLSKALLGIELDKSWRVSCSFNVHNINVTATRYYPPCNYTL